MASSTLSSTSILAPTNVQLAHSSPSHNDAFETIRVTDSNSKTLDISLRRTIRVPDNEATYSRPPDYGPFPLYSVSDFEDSLPKSLVKKGGIFIPIYQREAMWINFRGPHPFAVTVFVGGVNAVSGETKSAQVSDDGTDDKESGKATKPRQDYVVPPYQRWLDGILKADSKVSQFVATKADSGYSVEAQITGKDSIAGLQFEVVQWTQSREKRTFMIYIQTITKRNIMLRICSFDTIGVLKSMIQDKEGIPPAQQTLIFAGKKLKDDSMVQDYNISKDSYIRLLLRLREGGEAPPPTTDLLAKLKELTISPGGSIHQTVRPDPLDSDGWDVKNPIMFNVQLLDSSTVEALGLPVPRTPISAKTYADHGYPFFEMYEEPSGIFGNFPVQTNGKLDKASGINTETHDAEKDLRFRSVPVGSWSKLIPATGKVKLNTVDEKSFWVPSERRWSLG
ncbi:bacterial integral membrane protein-like protein-like protein [Stipitochalara longipes BDJ]|nr:bacterial integral membrane protein-like protein-like protein [Stipitochalara longipes BDJ]